MFGALMKVEKDWQVTAYRDLFPQSMERLTKAKEGNEFVQGICSLCC